MAAQSGKPTEPTSGGSTGSSSPPLSHLELFPSQLVLTVGLVLPHEPWFKVIARDAAGAAVPKHTPQYSSSNAAVVSIDAAGRPVATGVGTATVRASAGGQSAETLVHVGAAAQSFATPGPVLDANYIDLSKIERVSRFRSTVGHSYVDGSSETCRSMKHYFQPRLSIDWTTVDIYAPAAGTIVRIGPDGFAGFRIEMRVRDLPMLEVAIFHVNLDSGIVPGTWVAAGSHLGRHAARSTMSDIAASIGGKESGRLFSYFDVMTDAVFAHYQARGVRSRDSAIITRVERDADPVPCVGEQQFTVHGKLPDWLVLN